ncbi:transglutaminase domain-containing protein [Spongiimicrobium salis]|uniref:transglutaminase domain-containing protein n=1 Tax=Spongiimicrobium salis TaxID=1667022 RepID=UPI00374CC8B4
MIRTILSLFFLLYGSCLFAASDYTEIDKRSKKIPDSLETIEEITTYLTNGLSKIDEKVRAIYVWTAHNIRYDISKSYEEVKYTSYDQMVVDALESRKGVCEHYAQLFHRMCALAGVKSYVIAGYTRQEGDMDIADLDHAWNAVEIGKKHYFIDATWASGYQDDKTYRHIFQDDFFLIEPKEFIKTHMPFDLVWQFLDNPLDHSEFEDRQYAKLFKPGKFSFKDSIAHIATMDSIVMLERAVARIKKSGLTHILIKEEVARYSAQIENIKSYRWFSSFSEINDRVNRARDSVNEGIIFNNTFISYANKRFKKPKIEKEEIKRVIEKANNSFYAGKAALRQCKRDLLALKYTGNMAENAKLAAENTQNLYDFITRIEFKILEIGPSIEENKKYAQRYLKKWKPLRFAVPREL